MSSLYSLRGASARDQVIVETVERFRQITAGQLRRLHFADGSEASRAIRQRRVLARLVRDGMVSRLPRPIGGGDGGSGGYVYQPVGSRARIANPHTIDIAELHTRLREAERGGCLRLLDAAPEPYCHAHLDGLVLKPDYYVRLQSAAGTFRYFIEIDRGTEWRPQLRAKLRAYGRAFGSWTEPTFPKVVFLVPDELRRAFIAAITRRESRPELFDVTTFAAAVSDLIDPR